MGLGSHIALLYSVLPERGHDNGSASAERRRNLAKTQVQTAYVRSIWKATLQADGTGQCLGRRQLSFDNAYNCQCISNYITMPSIYLLSESSFVLLSSWDKKPDIVKFLLHIVLLCEITFQFYQETILFSPGRFYSIWCPSFLSIGVSNILVGS